MVQQLFPAIFLVATLMALAFGVQGRLFPEAGKTARTILATLSWVSFLAMIAVGTWTLSESPTPLSWSADFFSLDGEGVVARLGLELSVIGVLVCWIVAVIYGHVFFVEPLIAKSAVGILQGSAVLGMSAISIAWFSSSLWTSLLAQVLAALSGWTLLSTLASSRLESCGEFAAMSLSYVRERGLGISLVILGAGICAASGARMEWGAISQNAPELLGLLLIVLGSMLQLQLFPALSWGTRTVRRCTLSSPAQLLVGDPSAWVSFATLYRVSGALSGSQELIMSCALVLALLTTLSALGRSHAQSAFGLAASALSGICVAVLFGCGARLGGSFFIISQLVLWSVALLLRNPEPSSSSRTGARFAGGLAVLALFGGPGFASAGVLLGLVSASENIVLIALAASCWVLLALAMMRTLASPLSPVSTGVESILGLVARKSSVQRFAPLVIAALLSLAIFWSGDLVGPFAGDDGAMGPNWSARLFGASEAKADSSLEAALWGWVLVLVLLVSIGVPERLAQAQLKGLALPARGYGISRLMELIAELLTDAIIGATRFSEKYVTPVLFGIPLRGLNRLCASVVRGDKWIFDRLDRVVRGLVEIPAKGLQLMQSGSIQVYILFTVGFTLAMLLHFISQMRS